MFLKRQKRRKNGEDYFYWELVRTVRTAAGPRHETVAYLGKLDEGEARREYGWPDILEFLRGRGARYLVGTPKSMLRKHEAELLDADGWQTIREGLEVKLAASPDGADERFVLCRSRDRAAKERAMLERQMTRLRKALDKIDAGLRKRPSPDAQKVERRIGRWLGRNPAADRVFDVAVVRDADGRACALRVNERAERMDWSSLAHGAYLLRTNHACEDPAELWKWYIQLTQAEAAFRASKSDLALRPVFHQKEHRVEAHILVCFLALAMWRTLEQWMASKGLGTCARQFLLEMDRMHSMDLALPTDAGVDLRLRVVSKPEKPLAMLLERLGLSAPQIPKKIANVVQTF